MCLKLLLSYTNESFILQHIKVLYDSGVLELIAIISSPIISLIILYFTLKHDKKQFKIQLNNQKSEHAESIRLMCEQHNQSLNEQKESNRISAMPYFVMSKNTWFFKINNSLRFTIYFSNEGNGTATSIRGKYINNSNIGLMCETPTAYYNCRTPFDFTKSVVKPNGHCHIVMDQTIEPTETKPQMANSLGDEINFSIEFKDMYNNTYEQSFMFQILYENDKPKIGRAESYVPNLIVTN